MRKGTPASTSQDRSGKNSRPGFSAADDSPQAGGRSEVVRRRPPRVETAADPLRIVALGGGTGLSVLLQGLKQHAAGWAEPRAPHLDLVAVVTVSDDGGSSGRLRRDFDMAAPGDIRNCMVALAEDEALLSRLFQYRFESGRGLSGHSFGNLFLTALTNVTGDFHQAIQLSSEVLAIRGRIYPSTLENVRLEARLQNGRSVRGETRISGSRDRIRTIRLKPRRCHPVPDALAAMADADLITIGPGSLYTSVVPNLLVEGIPEAITASPARKVYVSNLMWEPGETEGYSVADHLRTVYQHAAGLRIDQVVVNSQRIPDAAKRRYQRQRARPVPMDSPSLKKLGIEVLKTDLLAKAEVVRHDPLKLARILIDLARSSRAARRRRAVSGAASSAA